MDEAGKGGVRIEEREEGEVVVEEEEGVTTTVPWTVHRRA